MFLLIQPRSPWGEHIYLPNGLLAVAARLEFAGIKWKLIDENLKQDLHDYRADLARADTVGIGCLGPPYVSEVIRVTREVRALGFNGHIMIGGELVKRLSQEQFDRIFAIDDQVMVAADEDALASYIGQTIPSIFHLSIADTLTSLSDDMLQAYFRKEWCLFTSQGCIYNCNFCAATKRVKERFRSIDAIEDEAEALAWMVGRFAGTSPNYEVYCSTLDGFQTPERMSETLFTVSSVMESHGINLPLRFLATAKTIVSSESRFPGIARRFRKFGVGCVGIGVDGDDPAAWARENKRHNSRSTVSKAFSLLKHADIQPEAFMVIGLPQDNFRAVIKSSLACFRFAFKGIRPRPYLGKSGVPGSAAWGTDEKLTEMLLSNPVLFREFEYAGLGSRVTHPDPWQRRITNTAFMATCLGLRATRLGCTTQPLLPSESGPALMQLLAHAWNSRMPQDR
jgi:hypothetical protein